MTTKQISLHIHQLYFGGSWTTASLQNVLEDVSWHEAQIKVNDCNTIVTLVYHINYFVSAVADVLEGKPLDSKDALSFNHPPINNESDWNGFLEGVWKDGKRFSQLIEQLTDEVLITDFIDPKYGNYFRNLLGILEHGHYHLGQISLLKKMIRKEKR